MAYPPGEYESKRSTRINGVLRILEENESEKIAALKKKLAEVEAEKDAVKVKLAGVEVENDALKAKMAASSSSSSDEDEDADAKADEYADADSDQTRKY